jgi:hypothetical protein
MPLPSCSWVPSPRGITRQYHRPRGLQRVLRPTPAPADHIRHRLREVAGRPKERVQASRTWKYRPAPDRRLASLRRCRTAHARPSAPGRAPGVGGLREMPAEADRASWALLPTCKGLLPAARGNDLTGKPQLLSRHVRAGPSPAVGCLHRLARRMSATAEAGEGIGASLELGCHIRAPADAHPPNGGLLIETYPLAADIRPKRSGCLRARPPWSGGAARESAASHRGERS